MTLAPMAVPLFLQLILLIPVAIVATFAITIAILYPIAMIMIKASGGTKPTAREVWVISAVHAVVNITLAVICWHERLYVVSPALAFLGSIALAGAIQDWNDRDDDTTKKRRRSLRRVIVKASGLAVE